MDPILRLWAEIQPKELRIDLLIYEGDLRMKLKLPRETVAKIKEMGCPYLNILGKAYFHEQLFTRWLLENFLTAEINRR